MITADEYDAMYSPDGLDEASIDLLIADVEDGLAKLPFVATSALLDGTAWRQRYRRTEQRMLDGAVRVLRVRATSVPAGAEAA